MNARVLALMAILFALLLAGCSFRGEANDDDDSDGGGVSVGGEGDDDENDSPGPGLMMVLATFGLAGLARRRFQG